MMTSVFVVEDDYFIRTGLQMLLEMDGHHVQGAANGREALDLLKGSPRLPCVILLDLMMPVMDGIEFRRLQLQDPNISHVPVIIITGRDVTVAGDDLRPLKVFRKPFQPEMVAAFVGEYCDLQG